MLKCRFCWRFSIIIFYVVREKAEYSASQTISHLNGRLMSILVPCGDNQPRMQIKWKIGVFCNIWIAI